MLQVWLLGQFETKLDGRRVVLSARAAQSLLAYLMLSAGTPHPRAKLAGLLWSDFPEENARRNLRQELWRLRKALASPAPGAVEYILAEELDLTLNANAEYWLDAAQLQKPESDLDTLISAVSLYRGELLPGMYDDWILLEREHLQAVFDIKMQSLLEQLIDAKRWNTVIEWSERWIVQGQTPEPAYRALMVAHHATGNRAKIAGTYERCRDALKNDLGVEPSEETNNLYEQIIHGQQVTHVDLTPTYVARLLLPFHEEPPAPGEPPFKGLEFFDEKDADLFFGREQLTTKLVRDLRERNFLAVVVGASGSGKSSIVRAGVVPALKKGMPGAEDSLSPHAPKPWTIHVLTPSAHPLQALATALTQDVESVTATATLIDDLTQDPRALHLFLLRQRADNNSASVLSHPPSVASRSLGSYSVPTNRPSKPPFGESFVNGHVLIVIDQFEEIFTLCRDEYEREAFIDNLLTALSYADDGSLTVLLTIRADFYAHLAQYPELRDAVARHQEFIGPMTSEELRRAMEGPARIAGWDFEPGLVDLYLRDVGEEPGALPLLSHALLETWKRRSGHTLTLKGYHDAGGVRGAIAQTAETTYQQLSSQEQAIARNIFLRLTELGEGTEDTRRRASFAELVPQDESAASVNGVLRRLADARLVTLNADTAEVAHEALIREWPQLREWLNQDRDGLRLHRQITEAAQEWEMLERDTGALYRGARLLQAREWTHLNPYTLNADERAFLEASQENEEREIKEKEAQQRHELEQAQKLAETESQRADEQRRGARRLRWFAAGLALLLLAALGAAYFAFNQSNIAQQNFVNAERIRIASKAQIALDNGQGGDVPALLALHSLQFGYSPDADAALVNALSRGFTRQRYLGHNDSVYDVDFSPDGLTMATASIDATARIWDVRTGQELQRFAPPTRILFAVEFSPDGRYLLTGNVGTDGARLWDIATGQEVRRFTGHVGGPWDLKISPDGQSAVTGDDGMVHLWNMNTGEELRRFDAVKGVGFLATFSPDGQMVAASGGDGTVLMWEAATGQELLRFNVGSSVPIMVFSPDGKTFVVVSGKIAQLFDFQTGQEVRRFVGHTDLVAWAEFSPDGRYLVTTSQDKTARLWDVTTGQELRQFIGHTGAVYPVAFSPDGKYILTGSGDRTTRLWDVSPEIEPHRVNTQDVSSDVFSGSGIAALSTDGEHVKNFAASEEERAKAIAIWGTRNGDLHYVRPEITTVLQTISTLALSPDNRILIGGGDDGVVWVWDSQTGRKLYQLASHTSPVRSLAFSPDGRLVLSGSEDKTARLWDLQTGKELQQFIGHAQAVRAVGFSPDGKFVLTGSDDHTARLWDAQTGKELHRFNGHTAAVHAVAYSPDGKSIATGSDDQTARVWDAQTGKELVQFIGHTGQVSQVTFSPDGQSVLTGSADQTARLWNAQIGRIVRQFAGHVSPVLYLGFADNGRTVISGDTQNTYRWRASLDDILTFTCAQLTRDLTTDERALYGITDNSPTCAKFAAPAKTQGNYRG